MSFSMTPDQFFDELDKLFDSDDGYINHLERIKTLQENIIKVPKGSMNYGYMKELEEENKNWCHSNHIYEQQQQKLEKEIKILKEENNELKEENQKIGGLVILQTQKLRDVSIKHNELVEEKNKIIDEFDWLVEFHNKQMENNK